MESGAVPGQLNLLGELQIEKPQPLPQQHEKGLDQSPDQSPDQSLDASPREPSVQTLLILDTETSGLEPESDHCLEIGAILFDVPSRQVLAQMSCLLPVASNAAEAINRIPAAVTRLPQPWKAGLDYFQTLLNAADLLVAHNAAFDRQWLGRGHLPATNLPWLCTMEDIRWPRDKQLRSRPSVRDLALAYEIPVWAAHRALTDCVYLAEVFRRCDQLEQLIEQGMEPRTLMRAQISYDDRQLAREAGFRWNDPVKGAWSRRLSRREAEDLPFPVVVQYET